ncbi:MAG: Gfo/Idh/MocA family oxidoreductase [Planctomycetota bacterium]
MHEPTEFDRRSFMAQAGAGLAAVTLLPSLGLARQPSAGADIRVGVVGAGTHGRDVLREIGRMEGARVVAVCEPDERRLRSALRRGRGAEGFASIEDLLAADLIDAAVIATPTYKHLDTARPFLERGMHAYLETPLAHTPADTIELARLARGDRGVVAGGLQTRSNPVYQLARGFARSDSVRDVVSMRAQHHRKTTWRSAGSRGPGGDANWKLDPARSIGLAGEWGTQQFDLFHWYTDSLPTHVRGHGSIRMHQDGREMHDTIACTLEFPGGADMQYSATIANSYEGRYEVLYGTNAAIKLAWSHGWMFKEADAPTQGWEVYANRQQFHNDEGITLIAGATQLAEQGKLKDGVGLPYNSLYYNLADWLGAIESATEPASGVEAAARATLVGIAAHRAITTGERVEIDTTGV